jgi:hypothetical protein
LPRALSEVGRGNLDRALLDPVVEPGQQLSRLNHVAFLHRDFRDPARLLGGEVELLAPWFDDPRRYYRPEFDGCRSFRSDCERRCAEGWPFHSRAAVEATADNRCEQCQHADELHAHFVKSHVPLTFL